MTSVISVGYEGRSIEQIVATLTQYGVQKLIDVRELPISRKRGFSKNALGDHLQKAGIEYLHLKAAGNPHHKKKADVRLCLQLYQHHLELNPEVVEVVAGECFAGLTAVLCYERMHSDCHRSILLAALLELDYISEIVRIE